MQTTFSDLRMIALIAMSCIAAMAILAPVEAKGHVAFEAPCIAGELA